MSINELKVTLAQMNRLQEISRRLRRLYTNACNRELSVREVKHMEALEAEAEDVGQLLGFKVVHQRDPRGQSLQIFDRKDNPNQSSNYLSI